MRRVLSFLTAVTALTACGAGAPGEPASQPERLRVEVLAELPHDPEAFTQGLEFSGDTLYEGTGLVGRSTLRAGPPGGPPRVTVSLPEPLFGEGITVAGSRVWQLTWRSGVALERDPHTLAERRRVEYEGEGWGLCHQGHQGHQGQQDPGEAGGRLVMSDGTARLTFRDPVTFAETGSVTVTEGGSPVTELNELECVGPDVYANVWQTDEIVRIDPRSGTVTARVDASGLLTPEEREDADVLNGIAAYPGTDQFLITGKLWPKMFRVKLVPVA